MENMLKSYLDRAQVVHKNVKPMEHSVRKLTIEDQMELMKWIKPCSVVLDVLEGKQNFKVICMIHNRYECRCINRNQRHIKCLFCSGCSVQNKLIVDKKKNYRCPTKKSDTSQWKQKKKMKSLICVNKQFSKENSADTFICADEASKTVQKISNGSVSKTLNSHDFSSSKPEEGCTAYQCDNLSYVFVDVDSELVNGDYLLEEGEDICKVSSETLFADHKDIDKHLVKSVKIEQDVEGSSRENDISAHNLDTHVFNNNDICTNNDRPGLATNQLRPKIKEEMDNFEEVSILNESVISIELHPVGKIEGLQDISENNMPVLDESCLDELPDYSNKEIKTKDVFIGHKPLKATGAVQREMEQFQNEVQTLNWTFQSDLPIKLETNSRDYDATAAEEYVNKLCVTDENMQLNSKNYEKCQNQRNENSKPNVDRPFVCTIREEAFTQLSNLRIHKRVHIGEKPFGCTQPNVDRPFGCTKCGKALTQQVHLQKHKCIYTGEKPFGCTICDKAFARKYEFATHQHIHTGDRPFGCSICGKTFALQEILIKHIHTHTGEKPFGCTVCGKSFAQQDSLKTHKHIHNGNRPFGCTICGKAFTRKDLLTSHKRIHTGEKSFGCTICGKAFPQTCNLIKHKRIHTGEKPFGCTICGKTFTVPSSVTRHKRIHTGEKPFGCSICGKTFTLQDSLIKHKRVHTGEKPYGCNICGKTFTQGSSLTQHKRLHNGEKPIVCTVCRKVFITLASFLKHKSIHTRDKPFGCTICGKAFTELSHLTRHKRVHTGEKPFGCTICGKSFARQDHLIKHKHIHTGNRPFGCTVCGKAFARQDHLIIHKRIHTVDRPSGCSICGKAFALQDSLIKHIHMHS